MWQALYGLSRCVVTPVNGKHRVFVWLSTSVCPDHQLIVVARDDDTTFGILQSRFHEMWSLRLGTEIGKGNDPRYTHTTTFETFPFPDGLTPACAIGYADNPHAVAIAAAARELVELRDNWLNPTDCVDWTQVHPKFPPQAVPRDDHAATELKRRTLTRLYNARPQWLVDAHADLDASVADAYGWEAEVSEDETLRRLLALNRERGGWTTPLAPPPPRRAQRWTSTKKHRSEARTF